MKKVKLLRYKCIGCRFCVSAAPELWQISRADGKVEPTDSSCEPDQDICTVTITDAYMSHLKESIEVCPVNAIRD
ncbi:MAG TPA: ferredoxin [Tenuifilaceae bacterium]|nr:ferredoxin [Tenuifilaceae bacterium]HQB79339.1 ferredoxin [Tenuifilaceae bacterium]